MEHSLDNTRFVLSMRRAVSVGIVALSIDVDGIALGGSIAADPALPPGVGVGVGFVFTSAEARAAASAFLLRRDSRCTRRCSRRVFAVLRLSPALNI